MLKTKLPKGMINEVICDACYDRIDADISEAYDRFYNQGAA